MTILTDHDGFADERHARLFARYSTNKIEGFQNWLNCPHGREVYSLFRSFANQWQDADHEKCGASLLGNRIRWEMNVTGYGGYKVPNNYLPMMARQLAFDDSAFANFFNFLGVA